MKSGSRFAAPRGEGTTMTLRMLGTGCLAWSLAVSALGGAVAVSVANPPATGAVVALLFDSADAFADLRDPVATRTLAADGTGDATFEGLPITSPPLVSCSGGFVRTSGCFTVGPPRFRGALRCVCWLTEKGDGLLETPTRDRGGSGGV